MDPNFLSGLAGVGLSLLFSYVPGLNTRFGSLSAVQKRLVMAGLLLVVAAGALLWSCKIGGAVCLQANWITYLTALGTALVANQSTYSISPLPAAVAVQA